MEKNNWKGWLYLLPASVFLGLFLVYPLIDVLTYSFEEDIILRPRPISAPDFTTTTTSCATLIFYRR